MGYIGNFPTALPLSSNDLNDGIVTTSKLANDSVNASKLDETDNYAFTGTVSGAGAWNLISTNEITTAVNTVEWTGLDDTYKVYVAVINNMQLTGDGGIGFRIGDSGGYKTSNYRYTGFESVANTTAINGVGNTSSNRISLSGSHYNFGGDTFESANLTIWFYNLRGTSGNKHFLAHTSFVEAGNYHAQSLYSGRLYETTAMDRIQFGNIGGGSNMDTGTFSLYGVSQ